MSDATWVFLPSPFLGPSVWRPAAELIAQRGADVMVARFGDRLPATGEEVLADLLAAVPEGRPVVLVPHSNAGLYVPALVAKRRVSAVAFVDAALPPAAATAAPTAPSELRRLLAAKADEQGLLPPWTQWWDEDVGTLFPDASTRRAVEAEQRRIPVAYLDSSVPLPAWRAPCAYLAFGDTYGPEIEQARAAGWPVCVLDGQHLHMLVDPRVVAERLEDLVASLLDLPPDP